MARIAFSSVSDAIVTFSCLAIPSPASTPPCAGGRFQRLGDDPLQLLAQLAKRPGRRQEPLQFLGLGLALGLQLARSAFTRARSSEAGPPPRYSFTTRFPTRRAR
jgi:hypothetical protein